MIEFEKRIRRGKGMRYKVVLRQSKEGYDVSCPGLPGCWSQGKTEAEAIDNIRSAIVEYLEAVNESLKGADVREIEVPAQPRVRIPGISHQRAVRALQKAGFRIIREGKRVVMPNGSRYLTIPRANPINAYTMAGIVKDAGLTPEAFEEFL